MSEQQPERPFVPEHGVITNSPLNPNHPSSAAYQPPRKSHAVTVAVVTVAVIAVAGLILILAGCGAGQQPTKQTGANPPASTSPTSAPSSTDTVPPAAEETTAPPDEPSVAKIGATQWFTYEDGVKIQVTKAVRFKIGPYDSGGTPGGPGMLVTVTIRNSSKATVDLSGAQVNATYGSNGDAAEEVYGTNYGDGFSGTLTPGKAKTAKFGFALPKGRQSIDIEAAPGFDYNSSHFEGSLK